MPTEAEDDAARATRLALAAIDADHREAYHILASGLAGLEAELPAECSDETSETVGRIIKKGKAAATVALDNFKEVTQPQKDAIELQRGLWKALSDRAETLWRKAQGLAEALLQKKREARERDEAEARRKVAEQQRLQQEAEARALAAETPEAQKEAVAAADTAWQGTRDAVRALDAQPATTSVKVGEATVYETERVDFEILDIGAFATAHPELVEIRRGATLAALREAVKGMPSLPETLPGWPGVKIKKAATPASR